ncbi:pre-mRNA-splicing factor 18-like [Artemia franciscana]|uniref:pre-mRNA-splicing factor 18-like n=1 Tax=Artemia franciscana TaxID=6661 RepID=UPI0032D9DA2A
MKLLLQKWRIGLNNRTEVEKRAVKGKLQFATYAQTQSYLRPLMKKLRQNNLPPDIQESLTEIIGHLLDRNYIAANDAYLRMAIGNAAWPIGVTVVGIHA